MTSRSIFFNVAIIILCLGENKVSSEVKIN